MRLTFIGHACVMLENGGKVIVIDPFFDDFSLAVGKHPEIMHPDFVLLTHGHADHTDGLLDIAGKNTEVFAIVELAAYFRQKGLSCTGMNLGGSVRRGDLIFSLVPALHSSSDNGIYLGEPAGFVIKIGAQTVYHAGDTGIFGDMALINELFKPTVGLLPIGGHFTMDEATAAYACNRFFEFDAVIPIHYGTFPLIEADPHKFASLVHSDTVALVIPPDKSADFD